MVIITLLHCYYIHAQWLYILWLKFFFKSTSASYSVVSNTCYVLCPFIMAKRRNMFFFSSIASHLLLFCSDLWFPKWKTIRFGHNDALKKKALNHQDCRNETKAMLDKLLQLKASTLHSLVVTLKFEVILHPQFAQKATTIRLHLTEMSISLQKLLFPHCQ